MNVKLRQKCDKYRYIDKIIKLKVNALRLRIWDLWVKGSNPFPITMHVKRLIFTILIWKISLFWLKTVTRM